MSGEGYVLMHRRVRRHWIYEPERPRTKNEAWWDLIMRAHHAPRRVSWQGRPVSLQRGQLVTSERTLGDAWHWSRGRVRRFLQRLESETDPTGKPAPMVAREPAHQGVIITIVNYDEYQYPGPGKRPTVGPANRPTGGPPAVPRADHEECIKKELPNAVGAIRHPPAAARGEAVEPDSTGADRVEAIATEVMAFWNDLSGGGWSSRGYDGAHLRERIQEGRCADECCEVVEAAIALGFDHPRRVFSSRCFGDLLSKRRDQKTWRLLKPEFWKACDRYAERTA